MTTLLLILAALAVLVLFVVVIGQMCDSGSMWFVHVVCDTPATLCEAFVGIVGLILEVNKD